MSSIFLVAIGICMALHISVAARAAIKSSRFGSAKTLLLIHLEPLPANFLKLGEKYVQKSILIQMR